MLDTIRGSDDTHAAVAPRRSSHRAQSIGRLCQSDDATANMTAALHVRAACTCGGNKGAAILPQFFWDAVFTVSHALLLMRATPRSSLFFLKDVVNELTKTVMNVYMTAFRQATMRCPSMACKGPNLCIFSFRALLVTP